MGSVDLLIQDFGLADVLELALPEVFLDPLVPDREEALGVDSLWSN